MNVQSILSKVDKLVLSGGGIKGCCHIGALKYLEEIGLLNQIRYLAGTSIGALISALICLGYKSAEIEPIMYQFDYKEYQSIDLFCIFEKFGIDNFAKILSFIESLFIAKNVPPKITFRQLYDKTQLHLIFNTVCLNTYETTFLDYQLTPNLPVVTGIQMSMSIPYLFGCVTYQKLTYVDGAFLNNFIIDFPFFQTAPPDTLLGIDLHCSVNHSIKEIQSLDQYALQLFSCIYNSYMKIRKKPNDQAHIINISGHHIGAFDFNLAPTERKNLLKIGYDKTKEYFEIQLPQKCQSVVESTQTNYQSMTDELDLLKVLKHVIEEKNLIDAAQIIDLLIKIKSDQPEPTKKNARKLRKKLQKK